MGAFRTGELLVDLTLLVLLSIGVIFKSVVELVCSSMASGHSIEGRERYGLSLRGSNLILTKLELLWLHFKGVKNEKTVFYNDVVAGSSTNDGRRICL